MYCIYNDNHWSLVNIFVAREYWIILRVDPISNKLDKDTISILDHLRWTQTKGPNSAEAVTKLDDVLIDIPVQAASDTQTCGHRVLQYHAILGRHLHRAQVY